MNTKKEMTTHLTTLYPACVPSPVIYDDIREEMWKAMSDEDEDKEIECERDIYKRFLAHVPHPNRQEFNHSLCCIRACHQQLAPQIDVLLRCGDAHTFFTEILDALQSDTKEEEKIRCVELGYKIYRQHQIDMMRGSFYAVKWFVSQQTNEVKGLGNVLNFYWDGIGEWQC